MGGRLATAIAERLEDLGEPLSALILESSHPGLKTSEEKEKRLVSDSTLFERMPTEPNQFFDKWYSQELFGDFKETELGQISINEMKRRWNPNDWKRSLKILSTGKQKDYRPFLKSSTHPILYFCGEGDLKYSKLSQELQSQAPGKLEVKCLKGGFHNLHLNHRKAMKGPISEVLSYLN